MRKALTDLDEIVKKWRKLVPDDVVIFIKYDESVWTERERYAESLSMPETAMLFIRVAPLSCKISIWNCELPRDIEQEVVHEMLHYRHDVIYNKTKPVDRCILEAIIDQTAREFVAQDRGELINPNYYN